MSMQVISWEEYVGNGEKGTGNRDWGLGNGERGEGNGEQGTGNRDCCSDNNSASELHPDCSNHAPYSPVPPGKHTRTSERVVEQMRHGVGPVEAAVTVKPEWPPIPQSLFPPSLAVTIGVFDGVHKGHQSLIRRICEPPTPQSPVPSPYSPLPTVVTFKQNPLCILKPDVFTGDIINLEQKLSFLEILGVQLTVLIDFSEKFSKISGRVFIDLLLDSRTVKLIALGRNFRCGHQLDTGADEIQSLAEARGLEVWIAPPVMDEGQPVSSSRIRQALAAGRQAEAERLLGWPLESISPHNIVPNRR